MLAWLWSKPFGLGEAGLRSLSALAGTLAIPFVYLAARNFASSRAGLIAAALAAVNPYLVWYSQEARSYALMTLLVAAGLAFFAASLRQPTPRNLALWATASALALVTHYFAAFVVVPQALWLVLPRNRRGPAVAAVGAVCIVTLALLPLAVAQEGDGRRNGFTGEPLATRAGESLLNFIASEEPAPGAGNLPADLLQVGAAVVGFSALGVAALFLASRGSPQEQKAALVTGGVAAAGLAVPLLAAAIGIDFYNPRNLIAILVPLLVALGIGFGIPQVRILGLAAALAVCAFSAGVIAAVDSNAQFQRHDWRGIATLLTTRSAGPVIVVPNNGDDPLRYYLRAHEFDRDAYPQGFRIRTIDVVSTNYRVDPPPGFRLTREEGHAPVFILWRFEAPSARRVTPGLVGGRQVLSERSSGLVVRGN